MNIWLTGCRSCALSHFTPVSPATLVRQHPTHRACDDWRRTHMQANPDHWVSIRLLVYEDDWS